jgi:peptidoglycan hydrolase-like protein with peptidoglycan-binding domain
MKRLSTFLISSLFVLVVVAPSIAHAALTQSQINSILSLLQAFNADQSVINNVAANLNGQNTNTTPTYPPTNTGGGAYCSVTWSRDLRIGSTGPDVLALQQLLNRWSDTTVASYGPGSPGNETGIFGPATRAAVVRFQYKYGIYPSAGYFGGLSRSRLASVCGGSPQNTSGDGGYTNYPNYPTVPSNPPITSNPNAVCSIIPSTSSATAGNTFTLTWSTANMSNPKMYQRTPNGSTVSIQTSGSLLWTAESVSSAYDDIFYIADGSDTPFNPRCSATVRINPAPVSQTLSCTVTTNKSSYAYGETVSVSWTSNNALYGSLINDPSGGQTLTTSNGFVSPNGSGTVTANKPGTSYVTLKVYGVNSQTATCATSVIIAAQTPTATTTPTTPTATSTAAIDAASLVSTTNTPTITGTAANLSTLRGFSVWNAAGTQQIFAASEVPVTNGKMDGQSHDTARERHVFDCDRVSWAWRCI